MEIQLSALARCREKLGTASQDFADLGTDMAGKSKEEVSSSVFGKVEGASALADAVNTVWSALKSEVSAAESKLSKVKSALSTVETRVREGNRATAV
ncbi:hypothetical protein [Thermostaphylospora chromogena]|uniref:Excreted virulence factor EspC, type VII ESX diderm n=1 Tax=Thermostaphylospora chromogena TaxID=35622 RepID=A0A1H1ATM9_9ACTN|nr:hypothetical protein [Thermostaphylospora chromogena]SDQ43108.1 hypothetical protein SAMN04489764_0651 [Thermostaphylospora chromogena]